MLTAFNRAVAVCQPPPGLLVHADRGSQYTGEAFTSLLGRTQAIASLSRSGNPYDNALAESGWSTPKTRVAAAWRLLHRLGRGPPRTSRVLGPLPQQRLHSAQGYCTPPSKLNSTTFSTYPSGVSIGTRPPHILHNLLVLHGRQVGG